MACIIIPAHNESTCIADCLMPLQSLNPEMSLIVVANGCSDNTADIVREQFPNTLLIETPKASKALAIRLAEQHSCADFPRIYLDADIKTSAATIQKLIEAATRTPIQQKNLFVPQAKTDFTGADNWVKQYYRFWQQTAHVKESGFGAGTFLMRENTAAAYSEWPDLIADDSFARALCPDGVIIVEDTEVVVNAPKTLKQLVKVKSRSKLGNKQLKHYLEQHPCMPLSESKRGHSRLRVLYQLVNKSTRPYILAYILVNLCAEWLARYRWTFQRNQISNLWPRDHSSRS